MPKQMTWNKAVRYCSKFTEHKPVYDCNNQPHWIELYAVKDVIKHSQKPRLCSESPHPFATHLEPFTKNKLF